MYNKKQEAFVLLSDGTIFYGKATRGGTAFGEICFNTGTTGYQEVFTDPSYYGQLIVMTNAHIGNYGILNDDSQSSTPKIRGLICKNLSDYNSRVKSDSSLNDFLESSDLFAISDVDTRALVRYIRKNGSMNAVISTSIADIDQLKNKLSEIPNMEGSDLVQEVSTKKIYTFGKSDAPFKISVLDLGVKQNILRNLANRGMYLKVFPYTTSYEEMTSWNPDGYFISNGPGDPEPLKNAQGIARKIVESKKPLFGICLGHQVIAISVGMKTFKMHNGHRGINHPIKNMVTGKGEITSHNHGFAVDKISAETQTDFDITHLHLNDGTIQGIESKDGRCFSVQYHPEATPGPNDANYLFDRFLEKLKH